MATITAKLSPDEYLIPRKRLFAQLLSRPSKKIVLLTAGAGYGKTSLIASFFQQYPELLSKWVTLTEPVSTFKQLMEVLLPYTDHKPCWIVLDQTEHLRLNSHETNQLSYWIEHLPSHTTLVLSGRKIPEDLPYSRWKVQGKGMAIHKDMLAFTCKETEELIKNIFKTQIPDYYIQYIFNAFEGWPAGLALFFNQLPHVNSCYHFKCYIDSFHTNKDFIQYLNTEIVNKLPDHLLAFMLKIGLFCQLDEELLQEYMPNIPVYDYLNDEHIQLFFSENKGQFQLTRLFRNFFYELAQKKLGADTLKTQHSKIALFCRQKFRFLEALSHSLAANEDQLVIELIRDMAERYEPKEFLRMLDGWLEQFSPALHLSRLSFFLFRCLPFSLTRSLIEPLEKIAFYYEDKDLPAYTDVCHRLATIHFYHGDINKAIHYYKISLKMAIKTENEPMIALNMSLLGQMYRFGRENDQSFSLTRQALAIAESRGYKQVQMHALWNMAELLMDKGKLKTAKRLAEQSLEVSRDFDEASIIYPMCTISRYFRKCGKVKDALHWAGRALEKARLFNIAGDKGWVKAEIAMCLKAAGKLKEAQQMLEKSEQCFSGFHYMSCLVQKRLVTILFDQKKFDKAISLDKKAGNTVRKMGYTWLKEHEIFEIEKSPSLNIQLLGPLSIYVNGIKTKIKRKSSLRLLLLLTTGGRRRWSSDELIGLLFPDATEEAAANQLYVALSVLRKILEPNLVKGRQSTFIPYDGSHYYFKFEKADIDLEHLKQLLNNSYSSGHLLQAHSLYKGDLLNEYIYEEWLNDKREAIRNQYLSTLNQWLEECMKSEKLSDAAKILETMIGLDPYEEKYYLKFVNILIEIGEMGKARKIADKAIKILNTEIGIDISDKLENILNNNQFIR